MGLIYSDIALINGDNFAMVRFHFIGETEIKRMQFNLLVDTGSYKLCINKSIQNS